jgi:hypothetical protein
VCCVVVVQEREVKERVGKDCIHDFRGSPLT